MRLFHICCIITLITVHDDLLPFIFQDTLQEVSISEGEVLDEDDPIAKLLLQIRSPPNAELTDRSEGEISKGEYMEKQVTSTVVTRVKDSSEGKSSGK